VLRCALTSIYTDISADESCGQLLDAEFVVLPFLNVSKRTRKEMVITFRPRGGLIQDYDGL
jgi:hypothetical protein